MTTPVLVIGNKAYSSWSMRPWLLMKHSEIAFREVRIPLYSEDWQQSIARYSPSGKVPALIDGEITIWDSLAIAEYLAEKHPRKQLWPADAGARACARSVSAEMHSGFQALRAKMPMNVRRQFPGKGRDAAVLKDVARIGTLWRECRARFGTDGPFLFGEFCIADAMYAPVVSRLLTYEVELDAASAAYASTVSALPAFQAWVDEARLETEVIADYEQ